MMTGVTGTQVLPHRDTVRDMTRGTARDTGLRPSPWEIPVIRGCLVRRILHNRPA